MVYIKITQGDNNVYFWSIDGIIELNVSLDWM